MTKDASNPWAPTRRPIGTALWTSFYDPFGDSLRGSLLDLLYNPLSVSLRGSLGASLRDSLEESSRAE